MWKLLYVFTGFINRIDIAQNGVVGSKMCCWCLLQRTDSEY